MNKMHQHVINGLPLWIAIIQLVEQGKEDTAERLANNCSGKSFEYYIRCIENYREYIKNSRVNKNELLKCF